MTEEVDSQGRRRVKWGLVEWFGSITVTVFSLMAIGVGGFAWQSVWRNHADIRDLQIADSIQNERYNSTQRKLDRLEETPGTLREILTKLDSIQARLDRVSDRRD